MKKYVFFLVFIFFIIIIINFENYENIEKTFYEDNYNDYIISFLDGITINEYLDIFKNEDEFDYHIKNFELENSFNEKMDNQIKNITIKGGNYIKSLDEYLDYYIEILNENNKHSLLPKIQSGNIRISKIYIFCSDILYKKLLSFNNNV